MDGMSGVGRCRVNRYRRKRPKVAASILDSALSHTRRSDASEKREENSVSTFGRFRLWISFESSSVSVDVDIYPASEYSRRMYEERRSKSRARSIHENDANLTKIVPRPESSKINLPVIHKLN